MRRRQGSEADRALQFVQLLELSQFRGIREETTFRHCRPWRFAPDCPPFGAGWRAKLSAGQQWIPVEL